MDLEERHSIHTEDLNLLEGELGRRGQGELGGDPQVMDPQTRQEASDALQEAQDNAAAARQVLDEIADRYMQLLGHPIPQGD